MTAAAPSGVVTFLFTDIEGSTSRWKTDAYRMRAALAAHDKVLRRAIWLLDMSREFPCIAIAGRIRLLASAYPVGGIT